MAVPPIIDAAEFEAVQTLLKTRSPALTAPSGALYYAERPTFDQIPKEIKAWIKKIIGMTRHLSRRRSDIWPEKSSNH